ncbi:glycosyltransferase family 2 protein [Pedobacter hartonius]|uniref:Glycosyl transferase family 2 n=1 Tax=Pedobacter hartonius TaxID=425514 RepID=A0A1H4HII6_9SPHI|nr:glycosyltransferase family A protein [Pedobacter hartonius]SEB21669.1 Glycosyl transferase family 2 [Pedobacter hartonius]
MKYPLVSCIMPTANRLSYSQLAINYFLHQDYPNIELIIIDDGEEPISPIVPITNKIKYWYDETPSIIGDKRNRACEKARGEIIVHWDDDDWYAPDWVSRQVDALVNSGADICGLSQINFLSSIENTRWTYTDPVNEVPWVYGGTLCYWKSFWARHKFENMQAGEDNAFVWNSGGKIHAHLYSNGYLATIHQTNAGVELYENPKEKLQQMKWWTKLAAPLTREPLFIPGSNGDLPLVSCIMPTANRANFIPSAIDNFLMQNYPYRELVIIDDGQVLVDHLIPNIKTIKYYYSEPLGSIGTKRNYACEKATGSIIMHWDDDDWYAKDWISCQVETLSNSGADICGLNQIQFYSPTENKTWMTKNFNSKMPWLSGATLAYRKSFWEKHPFKDMKLMEDDDFIRTSGALVCAHNYYEGFIATLHPYNTSIKEFEDAETKRPGNN